MADGQDFFIGVYTHQVKSYCDTAFFERLHALAGNRQVQVVDNSPGNAYLLRLRDVCRAFDHFQISNIHVPAEPMATLFLRNVCRSANELREKFLQGNAPHLLIVESDVLPPIELISMLSADIAGLPADWGALGAIYYDGRHDFAATGVRRSDLVFAGCTVYRRELIERCPFRWCEAYPRSFPDAWMSTDATANGYSLWNDHSIRCEHLQSHSEHDLALSTASSRQ